jgi:hypothetical protein
MNFIYLRVVKCHIDRHSLNEDPSGMCIPVQQQKKNPEEKHEPMCKKYTYIIVHIQFKLVSQHKTKAISVQKKKKKKKNRDITLRKFPHTSEAARSSR